MEKIFSDAKNEEAEREKVRDERWKRRKEMCQDQKTKNSWKELDENIKLYEEFVQKFSTIMKLKFMNLSTHPLLFLVFFISVNLRHRCLISPSHKRKSSSTFPSKKGTIIHGDDDLQGHILDMVDDGTEKGEAMVSVSVDSCYLCRRDFVKCVVNWVLIVSRWMCLYNCSCCDFNVNAFSPLERGFRNIYLDIYLTIFKL